MIHFPHSSFLPDTTHMFLFLHWALGLWIPPVTSLGSRAKAAPLSLLYQTGVKSTNRLLWPNVIKLQPGSGQFTLRQFCLSCMSCISTEQQLSILLLKKDFITIRPVLAECCGITQLWKASASFLQLVAQWKWRAKMVLHTVSQCGVPPAAPRITRPNCVCHNTSVQMLAGPHTDS